MGEMSDVDWRTVRAVLLRRKQAEFLPEFDELCKKHGVILRAIIVLASDGTMAQAQIQVDLAE